MHNLQYSPKSFASANELTRKGNVTQDSLKKKREIVLAGRAQANRVFYPASSPTSAARVDFFVTPDGLLRMSNKPVYS